MSLILLAMANFSSGRNTLVSRAVHDIHRRAVRHTHSLARDLRLVFRGLLIPRASSNLQPVVYCKRGDQAPLVSGGSGNASGLPATATKSGSVPTASAGSPWILANSYVCQNGLLTVCRIHSSLSSFLQQGNDFFDGWDFFTASDPTHGAFEPNIIKLFFFKKSVYRACGLC